MKSIWRRSALALPFAALFGQVLAQAPPPRTASDPPDDPRLPNGKLQRDEILKSEHEQNLKDAARLAALADELRENLEKEDRFVLSLNTVKKTEEIEKLARKIRSRIRHD